MRAREIVIHNVRSICDATIAVKDVSIIAGPNNAGKSNVVDAIRLFYQELKWDDVRDTPITGFTDDESWVEIEFEPSANELAQLKDEYRSNDGTFRVRNYLKAGKGSDGKPRSGYYAYVDGNLSETLFYGAKNVGSGKVGKIVYIPAVSKVDEHTKLTGPSALRDLVANVFRKAVSNSTAYTDLTTAFATFESQIKSQQSLDGQSLQALEADLTAELAPWEAELNLGIQSVQPDDIVKSLIRPQLFDLTHGGEVDQARFGAGFQRHLIYTLIKMAARYASDVQPTAVVKKEFAPELTWILFEEPEAFLHPSQEEVLFDSLLGLVSDPSSQVLITTHSSRFVSRSMDDLTRLIRVRRDSGASTCHQLSQVDLDGLFDSAHLADQEIQPELNTAELQKLELMSSLKLELWIQPHRAAAFFAKRVVLVEGPSEVGLYSYLINRGTMPAPGPGVVVIDCMGKYNLHRFMGLLSAFGVDHSVLYDGDGGGARDSEVTKSIADAKSSFTKVVKRLDHDIETELGIAPLRSNKNRKPQYLLYHLESGLIDKARLAGAVQTFKDVCIN